MKGCDDPGLGIDEKAFPSVCHSFLLEYVTLFDQTAGMHEHIARQIGLDIGPERTRSELAEGVMSTISHDHVVTGLSAPVEPDNPASVQLLDQRVGHGAFTGVSES